MKPFAPALAAPLFAAVLGTSLANAQDTTHSIPMPPPPAAVAAQAPSAEAQAWVQKHLAGWPQRTQRLGAQLVTKYGPPAEVTGHQVTWYGNGPWKRTTLYKEEVMHNFAIAHEDVLEQTVSYRVPPDKVGEITQFNGSVVVNRTRGELSSTSDSEETNFLALNVADDIVKGERDVERAMTYYAQLIRAKMIKEPERDLQALQFTPAKGAKAADPGEAAPLLRHLQNPNTPGD
jgi:hypothetical protein